ncbi:MAG: SLBB domain-containing protein [Acidobacteriota bacterium]
MRRFSRMSVQTTGIGCGKFRKMRWRPISLVFLVIGTFAGFAPAQSTPPSAEVDVSAIQDRSDLVHLGDLVDIDVVGSFEFDWRGTLTPEGFLDGLDKIEEPVYALCRSEDELSSDVSKAYSSILRDPKVVVRVLDRSNRAVVFLDGAVKFPQRFQIRRPVRLNELLIVAGGITENTSGEITVFRPQNLNCAAPPRESTETFVNVRSDTGPQTLHIKIPDLLSGDKNANPQILSGDVVSVVEALPVYIMGGVNVPKQVSARSRTTLSRAIAAAGGVSKKGIAESVTVYRRENGVTQVIHADLDKINAEAAEDIVLKPFDIVEVGQKGTGKRKFPPVIDKGGFQTSKMVNLPLRIIE